MNFFELLKAIILSLVLIVLIHSLFNYFKDIFTNHKKYDFVNKPNEKYNDIYETLKSEKKNEIKEKEPIIEVQETQNENKNNKAGENIKDELKNFLKSMQNNTNETTETVRDFSSSNGYELNELNGF